MDGQRGFSAEEKELNLPTSALTSTPDGLDLGAKLLVPPLDLGNATVGALEILGDEVGLGETGDGLLVCGRRKRISRDIESI